MFDLDEAADELYAGDPEAFVTRRNELSRQARAGRDRPLASAVAALRRPTRTAWLVNLLARQATGEVAALLDLADALREAQHRGDGSALRALSAQRRQRIDALTRQAVDLGDQRGYRAAEASVGEVAATLQAALADPEVAEQVRRGRLAGAVSYAGFGAPAAGAEVEVEVDLTAALAASIPPQAEFAPEDAAARHAQREEQERQRAEQQRREDRRRRLDEARAALEDARRAADRAADHADAQAERADRARAELTSAEGAEREARAAARDTRVRVREAEQVADDAERAWRELAPGEA